MKSVIHFNLISQVVSSMAVATPVFSWPQDSSMWMLLNELTRASTNRNKTYIKRQQKDSQRGEE